MNRRSLLPFSAIIAAFLGLSCSTEGGPTQPPSPHLATTLSIITAPSPSLQSRTPLATQPVLQLVDAGGSGVAVTGTVITASISAGGGTLLGTATATTGSDGRAAFSDLSLGGVVGTRTLTFASPGLASASAIVTVLAGAPSTATAKSPTTQTAVAGGDVGAAPAVMISDADANPVPGAPVSFVATSGGGTVTKASGLTDVSGVATAVGWSLGKLAGVNTVTATVTGLSGSPVTFTATGIAGAASTLSKVTGDGQSATVASAVSDRPTVKVMDMNGNAVSGATVTFTIASGGGSLGGATTVTDVAGLASLGSWTLGSAAGSNTLTAAATGVTGSVTFTATGNAGPASGFTKAGGDNQTTVAGTAPSVAPSVRIADANGNPVAGAPVTFAVTAGGGTVTGTSQASNASGVATVGGWTLGRTAGANTLTATAAGTPAVLLFTATGVAGAPNAIEKLGSDPSGVVAGSSFSDSIRARVTDANGNGVPAINVMFAVVSGSGSLSSSANATDSSGRAAVRFVTGTTVGINSASATLSGVTGSPITFATTTVAGPAASIAARGTSPTTVMPGSTLGDSIRVLVTDSNGNPRSGAAVAFAVTNGGGSVSPATATTDAAGQAAARFTTGASPGSNSATATVSGVAPLTFSITTAAAPVSSVTVTPDSLGLPITATLSLGVVLRDNGGAVLSGRAVSWQSADPSIATVDATGTISAVGTGTTTITATSEGKTGSARFTAEVLEHSRGGSCALTPTGDAYCQGGNSNGEQGVGYFSGFVSTPTRVVGGLKFRSISGNNIHTVALTADGTAYAWGGNSQGNLGNGDTTSRNAPTPVATSLKFVRVAVSGTGAAALTADGTAYAWGSVSPYSTVGVGDGQANGHLTPVAVAGGLHFVSIEAGIGAYYGITASGAVYAWGLNTYGELGDGTTTNRATPVLVSGGLAFTSLTAGYTSVIAITNAGMAYAWGYNGEGQLGDGSTTHRKTPVSVAGGQAFAMVGSTAKASFGLTVGGSVYTWGWNASGDLANGTADQTIRTTPAPINGGVSFRSISASSEYHILAITRDGHAFTWGDQLNGQPAITTPTPLNGGVLLKQ